MQEIYARGPIACTVAVTTDFVNYKGGIFSDSTGAKVTIKSIRKCFEIEWNVILSFVLC